MSTCSFDRQLAVVIRRQILAHLITREDVHHARTSRSCAAQRLAGAGQPRFDRPDRHVQRVGNFVVTQSIDLPQDDDRSLIERERVERRPQSRRHLLACERAIGRVAVARLPQLAVIEHVLFELHLIGRGGAAATSAGGCAPD